MKRKILIIIAFVCLITGLGFLLFAPVSNFIGQKTADSVIKDYDEIKERIAETVTADDGTVISSLKEAKEHGLVDDDGYAVSNGERIVFQLDLDRLLKDSLAYNEMLLTGQGSLETTDFSRAALDLSDYGVSNLIYCYITIDAINMRLPVYLGTSDTMMSYGAAHLYGTSLPVGDMDATCSIAGHTNYVGRIFFDNLRYLKVGDVVTITTWWGDVGYTVIDYKTISPYDGTDLQIQEDKKLLTLITCIPNPNGGYDRYIVICEKNL